MMMMMMMMMITIIIINSSNNLEGESKIYAFVRIHYNNNINFQIQFFTYLSKERQNKAIHIV
jgi:hypothetical protein